MQPQATHMLKEDLCFPSFLHCLWWCAIRKSSTITGNIWGETRVEIKEGESVLTHFHERANINYTMKYGKRNEKGRNDKALMICRSPSSRHSVPFVSLQQS